MTEFVWYMGLEKDDGEAWRMAPFCKAIICWEFVNWFADAGLNCAALATKAAGSIIPPTDVFGSLM